MGLTSSRPGILPYIVLGRKTNFRCSSPLGQSPCTSNKSRSCASLRSAGKGSDAKVLAEKPSNPQIHYHSRRCTLARGSSAPPGSNSVVPRVADPPHLKQILGTQKKYSEDAGCQSWSSWFLFGIPSKARPAERSVIIQDFVSWMIFFTYPWRIHGTSPVYLPIHEWLIFMINVGNYTIHGSYGRPNHAGSISSCSKKAVKSGMLKPKKR